MIQACSIAIRIGEFSRGQQPTAREGFDNGSKLCAGAWSALGVLVQLQRLSPQPHPDTSAPPGHSAGRISHEFWGLRLLRAYFRTAPINLR